VQTRDQGLLIKPAFYGEVTLLKRAALSILTGVRIDYFSNLGRLNVGPRLSARLRVSPLTWLKLGAGMNSQDPASPDYFSNFGNDRLRLERAAHFSLGVEQAVWKGSSSS
jgi:hypothetical protein